jgi:phasin family protein
MDRLVILHRVINTPKENTMSTLPEQFAAARTSQVEAQINFFQNYASSAVASTEKLFALNLSTTRASMEKSSAAVRQLLAAQDPRDLLALTTQTQAHFESMLAYGRQLFSIASDSQATLLTQAAPQAAETPKTPKVKAAAAAPALAAPALAPAPAPAPAQPKAAPAPAAAPLAKAKPVEKVVAPEVQAAAPFPVASGPVVVTSLKAAQATPPAAEPKQLDMLVPKPKAKK